MRAIPTQYKRANTIRMLMSGTPMMLIQPKPGFSARDCSGYFSVEASRMMMKQVRHGVDDVHDTHHEQVYLAAQKPATEP